MAVSLNRAPDAPIGELNTTPLIDVMLVLIVMLIVTLPLQTHAVKIDLPPASPVAAREILPVNTLGVERDGTISWNGAPVTPATLRDYLATVRAMPSPPALHFAPAAEARFEAVDRVLAIVKRSGVANVGFVGNERYASLLR